MAIIRLSPTVALATGSLGPVVFCQGKRTAFIKARAAPTGPPSPPQADCRAALARLSTIWSQLEPAVQDSWLLTAQYANLSPWNSFVSANFLAELASDLLVLAPHNPTVDDARIDQFRYHTTSGRLLMYWYEDTPHPNDWSRWFARILGTDVLLDYSWPTRLWSQKTIYKGNPPLGVTLHGYCLRERRPALTYAKSDAASCVTP